MFRVLCVCLSVAGSAAEASGVIIGDIGDVLSVNVEIAFGQRHRHQCMCAFLYQHSDTSTSMYLYIVKGI